MKAYIKLGLCIGLAAAAFTGTALAAGTSTDGYTTANDNCTVTYDSNSSTYSASYNQAASGQQYVLLVVKGTADAYSVSEDTIMYIDQTAAIGTTVSFDNWIPKGTPECVVLLGGGDAGPVVLGTLTGQKATVSGSVTSYNPQNAVTLELYKNGTTDNPVTTATIAAESGSGQKTQNFTLTDVPAGETYDLKITKTGHTEYWLTGIPVEGDMALNVTPVLSGGDVDGSGKVNSLDQNEILSVNNFNKTVDEAITSAADVDGSGRINALDINVVLSRNNYNKGQITMKYSN